MNADVEGAHIIHALIVRVPGINPFRSDAGTG